MVENVSEHSPAERIINQVVVLDKTLARIDQEVAVYKKDAARQKLSNTAFSAVLTVLAVATPALVTYQSQGKPPSWVPLVVIVVSAVAGAGTALQGVFHWGDRFRRTRLTAMELEDLQSRIVSAKHDFLDSDDRVKVHGQISQLNKDASADLRKLVRQFVESEIALVAPAPSVAQPEARVPPQAPPARVLT